MNAADPRLFFPAGAKSAPAIVLLTAHNRFLRGEFSFNLKPYIELKGALGDVNDGFNILQRLTDKTLSNSWVFVSGDEIPGFALASPWKAELIKSQEDLTPVCAEGRWSFERRGSGCYEVKGLPLMYLPGADGELSNAMVWLNSSCLWPGSRVEYIGGRGLGDRQGRLKAVVAHQALDRADEGNIVVRFFLPDASEREGSWMFTHPGIKCRE